ncbi:HET-domain-containing protein [Cadophora sp. DSE1049]|nr:HET-domain-containing protein [Cadophora sp. DSE1049]
MDYFWPTGLLFAILAFAIFRPFHAYTIASLEVARWFLDPHEYKRWVSDSFQLDRSLVVFSSYITTLLSLRGYRFFWWCAKAVLAAAWNRPLVAAAVFTTLLTFKRIVGFTYPILKLIAFLQWLHGSTYHLEWYRWVVVDKAKASVLFRVFMKTTQCLVTAAFEILGRRRHDELGPFKHPKMNPRTQIRLLDVRRNIPFLPTRAALVVVDIDDPPPYEAVSYTWDPNPTDHLSVAINGMRWSVPRNVHDILTRLGSMFSRRYIWIDSICINQDDKAEKIHQIKLMRHVYHQATRVLACLGESRRTGHASALLNLLVLSKWKLGVAGAAQHVLRLWQDRRSNVVFETHLAGFLELLDHRWFERAWVVQEVVFARRLTLHQRNYSWIWEFFFEAIDILIDPAVPQIASIFQSSMSYGRSRRLPYGLSHGIMMARTRALYQHGNREPLYVILQRFMAFKATVPHDKIFALLGFVDDDLDHLIDYEKPIEALLIEIAGYLLEQGHLIHVLHLAGTGYDTLPEGQDFTIPSWVTVWSASRAPRTLAESSHMPFLQYRAGSGQKPSMYVIQDNPRCLHAVGLVVDYIRHVGGPSRAPGVAGGLVSVVEENHLNLEWLDEAQSLAQSFAAPTHLGGSQTIEEAVLRTILGDRSQKDRPLPGRLIAALRSVLGSFRRIHNTVLGYGVVPNGDLSGLEARLTQHPELFRDYVEIMQSEVFWELGSCQMLIGDPEYSRRFCVTDEGKIGIVPRNARVGDIVVVLHGAQVPFIVRPKTETMELQFELIGECYVRGLMDGEALELGLPATELVFV